MSTSFSTRSETERRIAELGKAGLLKPMKLPGRRWYMVENKERTVSRSQLFHVLAVWYEKKRINMTGHELQRKANEIWDSLQNKRQPRKRSI